MVAGLASSFRRVVPLGAYVVKNQDIRLTYACLALKFAPVERFTAEKSSSIYAELCKRHGFEKCTQHGDDGVEFESEGVRSIDLRRDGIWIDENAHRSFEIIKREFTDQLAIVQRQLEVPYFVMPFIRLGALVPMQGEDGGKIAVRKAITLNDDQFELLGDTEVGSVGLSVHGNSKDGHFELDILPYEPDPSQITVNLEVHEHHGGLTTPAVIETHLDEAYRFFTEEVMKFIDSFARN
jgi:hypothetical protein